jgi:tetratricopeptide (TPR) repeat protein
MLVNVGSTAGTSGRAAAKAAMKTLYDLLGALPEDGAEDLRAAFRRAAKATHPDIHPDDPEAPLRFRQIVRANDILSDEQQRAAYDWILAFTQQPAPMLRLNTTVGTIRKFVFDAITVASVSIVSIGGYLLFDRLSKASVVPSGVFEVAARAPADNVAVAPTPKFDTTRRDEPPGKPGGEGIAGAGVTHAAIVPSAVAPGTIAASAQANANVGPAPDLALKDARSYWERGITAYRDGDLPRAIADFDQAIQHDPSFSDAYLDRGIALYRLHEFGRAFADITQMRRIKDSNRSGTAVPAPHKASP